MASLTEKSKSQTKQGQVVFLVKITQTYILTEKSKRQTSSTKL